VLRLVVIAAAAVLALAACGSSTKKPAAAKPPAAKPAAAKPQSRRCKNEAVALAKLQRDIAALRAAAKLPVKDKLIGNHAINVATDRFLNDVELAPIDNLQRNRLIDHAMSAIGTRCEQCFQAFEAGRPIPAIRAGEVKCG
jgi:hypothetical protein